MIVKKPSRGSSDRLSHGGQRSRTDRAFGRFHPRASSRRGVGAARFWSRNALVMMRVLLIGFCLSAAACADIRFVMFEPVQTDLIEKKLKVGSSTREDVRAVLGEPVGSGRVMYPFDEKPYTMLGYYYETGTMSETKSTWLVVFFDGETFKGYAWFSDVLKQASN